jgi:hypothetical protein
VKTLISLMIFFLGCTPDQSDIGVMINNSIDAQAAQVFHIRRIPALGSYWSEMPSIRVCEDSGVTRTRAAQIVSFWKNMGYSLGNTFFDEGSEICNIQGVTGQITIMLVNSDTPIGENLAITRTWHSKKTLEISKSQIYILGGFVSNPYLLEHEMGHALGWHHFDRHLHIMNSNYNSIGSDVLGLRRREYGEEIKRISK